MAENQKYSLFDRQPVVINVGVKPFAEGVRQQEVETVQVAWQPPADKRLARLLGKVL